MGGKRPPTKERSEGDLIDSGYSDTGSRYPTMIPGVFGQEVQCKKGWCHCFRWHPRRPPHAQTEANPEIDPRDRPGNRQLPKAALSVYGITHDAGGSTPHQVLADNGLP